MWCLALPTYEVFIDNKPRKVEISKASEKTFTIKVDGKSIDAELEVDKPNFEKFSVKIDGKTHQINLPKLDREKNFQLKVDEVTFKAEVKTPMAKASTTTTFAPASVSPVARKSVAQKEAVEGAVVAPMTGKIVSVKVKKGDVVKQKQVLCIIEAMKMENEIAASKAGTVREVNVSEGSSVSEGETLFVVG
jgi:glutaconyl-CoA decarboxylase